MLDLIIATNLSQAAASDELQDTLNYAEICSISAQVIQQAAPKLIEHAAQLVLDALFTTFAAIESITITIRKPAIIPEANSVGIRLERHRNDFCPRYWRVTAKHHVSLKVPISKLLHWVKCNFRIFI